LPLFQDRPTEGTHRRPQRQYKQIRKKLYDLAANELNRYLNAEKRAFIAGMEKRWDKYAVSSREMERERAETLKTLDGFLKGLGYLETKTP
jgi:type I restriction enzyme M protein